jgi:selenide,water dikinase
MDSLDDAGVYQLTEDVAIIQTVDFFTPIVDDPYMFGQIAAANSLSDIYAMGGKPLTAMNLVCFPIDTMDVSVLKDILRGGNDKMAEAQVSLMGGHSVNDPELKYGLSVTGTVHPKKLITNSGARAGDKLILTKPLGTGIISTALKAGAVSPEILAKLTETMAALNDKAAELMQKIGARSCTDITGFGLIGHAVKLAEGSQIGMNISAAALPLLPGVAEYARQGIAPGGLERNRDFYSSSVRIAADVPAEMQDILFDPQTSGGLLIALAPSKAESLLARLHQAGVTEAAIIGEVVPEPGWAITVK